LRTLHSTPNATANTTLSFLAALVAKNQQPLPAQVLLSGDFCGIHGVCGVPVNVDRNGWRIHEIELLTGEERLKIIDAVTSIERYVTGVRMAPLEFSMPQAMTV
jgi:malate dehydrogenase